jgi:hypothetical protein
MHGAPLRRSASGFTKPMVQRLLTLYRGEYHNGRGEVEICPQ